MCTAAQLLANRSNAQRSTGPLTPEGKARVSRNATKLGLFSTSNFVRPDELEIFDQFTSSYMAELSPQTPLEQTLAREIVQAAWRLRSCAAIESAPPEETGFEAHRPPLGRPLCVLNGEELDRLQASVDRARTTAQRTLHRALAELRRIRKERVCRKIALPDNVASDNLGQTSCRHPAPLSLALKQTAAGKAASAMTPGDRYQRTAAALQPDSAKQSQSRLTKTEPIPRNAACPCGSGSKYKRCCGKNAPPVLGAHAA